MNRSLPPADTIYLLRRSANETCLWIEVLGDRSIVRQAHKIDKPEIIEDVVTSPPDRKHISCLITSEKLAELAFGQSSLSTKLSKDIHMQCLDDLITVGVVHGYIKPTERQTILDQRIKAIRQFFPQAYVTNG